MIKRLWNWIRTADWKQLVRKILEFLLNPRFVLCFGVGWIITNGWSYLMMAAGTYWKIPWMIAVSGAYLTFLWFPFTPEKLVTVTIAIWLLNRLFPKDTKTLAVLKNIKQKVLDEIQLQKANRAAKKASQNAER
jgi:hypothetical protein